MKKILFLPLLVFSLKAFALDMGTVEVSTSYTATLIFSHQVETVIFGNNPQVSQRELPSGEILPVFKFYQMYRCHNSVILHAGGEDSPQTSITVILTGGKVYTGLLQYGVRRDKLEYDFTDKGESSEDTHPGGAGLMKERLEDLLLQKDRYLTLGVVRDQVSFMVANMRNDRGYTYLKINVINRSASEYIIDGIIFKHEEKKKGRLGKKEVRNQVIIMPLHKVMPQRMAVPAYSSQVAGFVLPLFTTGARGRLLIQFVEKNGSRSATLKIKARDMAKIDVF